MSYQTVRVGITIRVIPFLTSGGISLYAASVCFVSSLSTESDRLWPFWLSPSLELRPPVMSFFMRVLSNEDREVEVATGMVVAVTDVAVVALVSVEGRVRFLSDELCPDGGS